ncbi:MAG TPA: hypothetical protein VM915_00060 [Verrucomicrobiae bacterium]|jgi:hypothetical protein|nr:hypothetical protein [Verrucomicrobiae bacterium]
MAKLTMTISLPGELKARVLEKAKLLRRSSSSVAAAALRQGLADAGAPAPGLDNVNSARLDKILGETLILKEMLLVFVRVWLEHNPPLEEEYAESAAMSAEARFERFIAYVASTLSTGRSFADGEPQLNTINPPTSAHEEVAS